MEADEAAVRLEHRDLYIAAGRTGATSGEGPFGAVLYGLGLLLLAFTLLQIRESIAPTDGGKTA